MATSSDRLVAGLIGDRYEITGLIASGGMGQVYRARDSVLGRIVAIKVLREGDDTGRFAARFKTEATNAARLSHPNIVQVYDFGYADGAPYMAMEFVDGQTLRDVLQNKGVLRPDLAARIGSAVAAALEAARRQGIVHRDIKPENILITTDGQVKVADFGLSHALAESNATQTGILLGTAHYLAPEQVAGGTVDHRTDLYALGVMLYEMLTGTPPFSGDTPVVIAYKRVNEDVPSVLAMNPECPRALDRVVANLTARAADERTGTAQQVIDDLRDAMPRSDTDDLSGLVHHTTAIPLDGEQETIAISRRGPRGKRRIRRRRLYAMVALLTVLAGAALITGPFGTVEIPAVAALDQAQARVLLTERGFTVDEALENSSTVPQGVVITQVPGPSARARRGSVVRIVVSLGPRLVSLPSVQGERYAVAVDRLTALGFEVRRENMFHASVPKGRVISQPHSPGTVLEEGTTITLEVSKGAEMVRVPAVEGKTELRAVDDLRAAGFEVDITRERSDEVAEGLVIQQRPRAGLERAKGSSVALIVSLGPPLVKAPNFECMTKKQAKDAAAAKGITVTFSGSGSRVVDQDPRPGSKIPKGSAVTAFMGLGSFC